MGLFRRLGRMADRVYDASDLSGLAARLNRRRGAPVEALLQSGTPAVAVITGIRRFALPGDDPAHAVALRLEWPGPAGQRVGGAVISGQGENSPALRLGARIPIRYDDEMVIPDRTWPPGTAFGPIDEPPDPGITDARGRRPKKRPDGPVQPAQVESFTRRRVPLVGLPADSWDIVLRLADGTTVTAGDGAVPAYARYLIAPAAQVPVVADPGDPGTAWIDWHRLAEEHAAQAGDVDDPPPAGSIAESLAAPAPTQVTGAAVAGSIEDAVAAAGEETVEGVTLRTYAEIQAALETARVPPDRHDEFAAVNFGTPIGRWAVIDAAWRRRMMGDWRIGAAFGEAVEAAKRRR